MGTPELSSPDASQTDARWQTAGERIQTLLDACAAGGAAARERAEQLVGEVTDLYGAGLERVLALAVAADPALADAFIADDLVASLLLVHGLHPHSVQRRVADALDSVRPYLGSHGGDVHLLEIDGDTLRLRFSGSCKSCPSSAVTLELAVEDAVRAAAPEISAIEVVSAQQESAPDPAVIPAETLLSRVHSNGHRTTAWQPVPELAELAVGEVGGFQVTGAVVLACRVGTQLAGSAGGAQLAGSAGGAQLAGSAGGENIFAYRDRCAHCTESMAGARLAGSTLRCPRCAAAFDVVRAGAQVDGDLHLEPIPVLVRNGVLSLALAEEVA